MHVTIRRYAGAIELFEELSKREDAVRDLITTVPGFLGYMLVKTDDGGFTVTTCLNKSGTDEATRRASAWIGQNIPSGLHGTAPQISEGDVVFSWLQPIEQAQGTLVSAR